MPEAEWDNYRYTPTNTVFIPIVHLNNRPRLVRLQHRTLRQFWVRPTKKKIIGKIKKIPIFLFRIYRLDNSKNIFIYDILLYVARVPRYWCVLKLQTRPTFQWVGVARPSPSADCRWLIFVHSSGSVATIWDNFFNSLDADWWISYYPTLDNYGNPLLYGVG